MKLMILLWLICFLHAKRHWPWWKIVPNVLVVLAILVILEPFDFVRSKARW